MLNSPAAMRTNDISSELVNVEPCGNWSAASVDGAGHMLAKTKLLQAARATADALVHNSWEADHSCVYLLPGARRLSCL